MFTPLRAKCLYLKVVGNLRRDFREMFAAGYRMSI